MDEGVCSFEIATSRVCDHTEMGCQHPEGHPQGVTALAHLSTASSELLCLLRSPLDPASHLLYPLRNVLRPLRARARVGAVCVARHGEGSVGRLDWCSASESQTADGSCQHTLQSTAVRIRFERPVQVSTRHEQQAKFKTAATTTSRQRVSSVVALGLCASKNGRAVSMLQVTTQPRANRP